MMSKHKTTDRGYAWVVLVSSWLQMVISGVLYYSIGVINTVVLERMGEGVVKTSWVGSTLLGTIMFTGPITGFLTNLLGCRVGSVIGGLLILTGMVGASFATTVNHLIVSYGLVVGLGIGFIETGAVVSTGHYFERYRPLASGIQTSGSGWGMLAGAPLVRFLNDTFGIEGMFLLLGAVGAHACVSGMLMRPSQIRKQDEQQQLSDVTESLMNNRASKRKSSWSQVRKSLYELCQVSANIPFMLYVCALSLWGFGDSAFQVHLPNYVESKGTSKQNSALLYTAMGIASMIARILAGFAANDPAVGYFLLLVGCVGLLGASTLLFSVFSNTYKGQVIFSVIYGFYSGGPIALFNPISVELVGVRKLGSAYGIKNLVCALGNLAGPPFAGFILEKTGNYEISYFCSGIAILIACLLSIIVVLIKKTKHSLQQGNTNFESTIPCADESDVKLNTQNSAGEINDSTV